jgi:hypothetical protein
MGKQTEREKTTTTAKELSTNLLSEKQYTSALLVSTIYVDMRLRSLITDRLSPPKGKWQEISNTLNNLSFNSLLTLCEKLGLSTRYNFDINPLKKLWNERCKIAHESTLWRELSEKDIERIRSLCNSANDFMEKTKLKLR